MWITEFSQLPSLLMAIAIATDNIFCGRTISVVGHLIPDSNPP
ncbi:MAG: hypothetical protein ACXAC5_02800 [Promethearchaeota archaeon]